MSGPEINEVSAEDTDRGRDRLEKIGEDKGRKKGASEEWADAEKMKYIRQINPKLFIYAIESKAELQKVESIQKSREKKKRCWTWKENKKILSC